MNTYARKSEDFNQRIDFKFKEQIKKLDQSNIEQIQKIKEIENESMKLNEEYEKEIVIIKEKYIKKNEEINLTDSEGEEFYSAYSSHQSEPQKEK